MQTAYREARSDRAIEFIPAARADVDRLIDRLVAYGTVPDRAMGAVYVRAVFGVMPSARQIADALDMGW